MSTRLLILLMIVSGKVFAQSDYKTLDSLSYKLYTESRWKELASLGDTSLNFQPRFYYLDLRAGIAHYHLGHWNKAKRHLNTALELNPGSEFAAEHLFWIYYLEGRNREASQMAALLHDTIAKQLPLQSKPCIERLYLESGLRLSSKSDSAGNIPWYFADISGRLSPVIQLGLSFTAMKQQLYWSKLNQQQLSADVGIDIGKGWTGGISISGILFDRKSNIEYDYTTALGTIYIPLPGGLFVQRDSLAESRFRIEGHTSLTALNSHLRIYKNWNNFNIGLQAVAYTESVKPAYDSTVSTINKALFTYPDSNQIELFNSSEFTYPVNTREKNQQWQIGGSLDYTFRWTERTWIRPGCEVHIVLRDENNETIFIPYLELVMHRRLSLFAYYFEKGYYPVSAMDGQAVFNTIDKIKHRISITAGIAITQNTGLTITYQQEQLTDAFTGLNYSLNSAYAGLQINF